MVGQTTDGVAITSLKTSILIWLRKASSAILDQGIISASNFSLNILLARWLATSQYGAFALAYSIVLFLAGFHNALILEPMSVLGVSKYGDRIKKYEGTLLWTHAGFSISFLLIFICIWRCMSFFGWNANLVNAVTGICIAVPFIMLFWLLRRICYLEFKPKYAMMGGICYAISLFTSIISFRSFGFLSPSVSLMAIAIGSSFSSLVLFVKLRPDMRGLPSPAFGLKSIAKPHWEYGKWVIATAFVFWVSGNAYYFMANAFLGLEELGVLRALQNLALPVYQIFTALGMLLLPRTAARLVQGDLPRFRMDISKVTIVFISLAVFFFLVVTFLRGFLTSLLYGAKYESYTSLIPLIMLPIISSAVTNASSMGLRAMQFPKDVFMAYCVSSLATLSIGIAVSYFLGLLGLVIGLAISALVTSIASLYLYRRRISKF
jgi:O-antigen/teichoic acid export membrane protein